MSKYSEEVQQLAKDLLAQMTTEEKVNLLTGRNSFSSYPIERLNIPRVQYLDGGTGMNWEQLMGDWKHIGTEITRTTLAHFNEPEVLTEEQLELRQGFIDCLKERGCTEEQSGCYPPGILLGASWDPEVVYQCGQALGDEALDFNVDILLGTPNVNLLRNPLNGRFFEGYSEDPCLVSTLAPELVKGVQESGVLANVKHYAANNMEAYRKGLDEHIPERVLREMYLPGFQACVEQGRVKTLMTAYNKINGVCGTENKWLIQDVLRDEWDFQDYLVISDWGAVYDQVAALKAGNDIDMPGPRGKEAVFAALEDGTLPMEVLDETVLRALMAFMETPAGKKARGVWERPTNTSTEWRRQVAYRTVTEGAVLLKNASADGAKASDSADGAKASASELGNASRTALPMVVGSSVAIIGEESAHFHDCGDGSARVYTDKTSSLLDCMLADENYKTVYVPDMTDGCLEGMDYGVLTVYVQGQEGRDRKSLDFSDAQKKQILEAVKQSKSYGTKLILILNVCGPVDLRFCEEDMAAILCIFFPGMEGGHGVKDILTGKVNPSGKLPLTFPKRFEDCPSYLNPAWPDRTINYGEGLYVGYRYYDKKDIEPMYPFGYGLSYSSFEIDGVQVDAMKGCGACSESDSVVIRTSDDYFTVRCTITNTGAMAGRQVVQLYVNDPVSVLDKPLRELKAFQKPYLEAGESKELEFKLPLKALASFDPEYKEWVVEPGEYKIYLGTSSRELVEPVSIQVIGHSCYDYGARTPFIRIIDDAPAYKKMLDVCAKYHIYEADFQGFAVYQPYQTLDEVLDSTFAWAFPDQEERQKVMEEIYQSFDTCTAE